MARSPERNIVAADDMPKKPQRRPSPDILPDSLPPDRRDEESPDDVRRREAPETPDSLPPPDETIPGARVAAQGGRT